MSKVDAQRAMREAKYARAQEGAAARRQRSPADAPVPGAARERVVRPVPAKEAEPVEPAPDEPASQDLCGHRSMNGRTCTRESGHPQKNHRYN